MAHLIILDQGLPSLVYLGSETSTNTSTSTVTFSGCPLGTPRSDRVIIFGLGTSSDNIASVTIAGLTPLLASGSQAKNPSPFPYCGGIYSIAMPTGTSANIVFTASGTTSIANNPSVEIYAAYGLQSATSVSGGNAVNNIPNSTSVSVSNAGVAVGFALRGGVSGVTTWTGVTKDNQTNYDSTCCSCGSFGPAPSAQTLTVSVAIGLGSAPQLSVASYR